MWMTSADQHCQQYIEIQQDVLQTYERQRRSTNGGDTRHILTWGGGCEDWMTAMTGKQIYSKLY